MNKLIFRKFSLDIVNFFLIASFSITFIVWIIQAVNFLDLVSDDGHSLNVYFYYVSLNLPKIFSKIIIFVFFISIFYVINKYNSSNELIVFWNNGIKKIKFINFILFFSVFFLILQLVFNLFIVPKSQNLGRLYIKDSNIDFLPKLISEKKFINVVKNLTIFVEEYKKDGKLNKIYINEKIDTENSKIIVAESGRIIKKNKKYILRLSNGGITNISKSNTYTLNFSETDYDLSDFSTKTTTHTKVQELDSIEMFKYFRTNDHSRQIAISDYEGHINLYRYHKRSAVQTVSSDAAKRMDSDIVDKIVVKCDTLNNIIEDSPFKNKKIDFLTIDIEGHELAALQNFNFKKFEPKLVVIEYNDPELVSFEFQYQRIENIMNSKIYKFMYDKNYKFVNWHHADLIFISDTIFKQRKVYF